MNDALKFNSRFVRSARILTEKKVEKIHIPFTHNSLNGMLQLEKSKWNKNATYNKFWAV